MCHCAEACAVRSGGWLTRPTPAATPGRCALRDGNGTDVEPGNPHVRTRDALCMPCNPMPDQAAILHYSICTGGSVEILTCRFYKLCPLSAKITEVVSQGDN